MFALMPLPTVNEDHSLKAFNSFGIEAKAAYMAEVYTEAEYRTLLQDGWFDRMDVLILGGGSNVLFVKDFPGIVILDRLQGIDIVEEDDTSVLIKVMGGEVWHEFVTWCVEHEYYGIENLALIPGSVGAAPMQNIGAYGVEIESVFEKLEALERSSGEKHVFDREECDFGYRYSVFKGPLKGKYFITSVYFRLQKNPNLNLSYAALSNYLEDKEDVGIKDVYDAVCAIRSSKLPDPAKIGNAGSFFKNPVISRSLFEKIQADFPEVPSYPVDNENVKVPAGWLIEQCGWKGYRAGDAGCHEKQALVLVNHGSARGTEIFVLANKIRNSVKDQFGIDLEMEVNLIDG